MNSALTRPIRLGTAGLALALTTSLVAAAPANAASVDGNIGAFAYANAGEASCDVVQAPTGGNSKQFVTGDKRKRVSKGGKFRVEDTGVLAANGKIQNRTTGDGSGRPAFKKVSFTARHKIVMTNGAGASCDVTATADSQSGATVVVRKKGKIRLTWHRKGGGQLADIYLADSDGNVLVSTSSNAKRGKITKNVTSGKYNLFVQFYTTLKEQSIGSGKHKTRTTNYTFTARFVR